MTRPIAEIGEAGDRHGFDLDLPGRIDFVRRMTSLQRAPLVPEMVLNLAEQPHKIFKITEELTSPPGEHLPPFWAFAWPGGQGLARHLLDDQRKFGASASSTSARGRASRRSPR